MRSATNQRCSVYTLNGTLFTCLADGERPVSPVLLDMTKLMEIHGNLSTCEPVSYLAQHNRVVEHEQTGHMNAVLLGLVLVTSRSIWWLLVAQ